MEMYPYIKGQADVIAIVEAEYKIQNKGKTLPASFILRMLEARRNTILEAMRNEKAIKLDKLGKLIITNSTKDFVEVLDAIGGEYNKPVFEKELHRRFTNGLLNSQRFTKITKTPKFNYITRYQLRVSVSNRNNPEQF